jgi:hypothetical protein
MDGKRLSGVQGRNKAGRKRKKRAPGLRVEERDGYWHIRGTVRAGGRSARIRKGTGLVAKPENWDAAETVRLQVENEFRDAVIHGKTPSVPVAVAIDKYFGARPTLKEGERRKLREVNAKFGFRTINEITDEEWAKFIARRHERNSAATRERYLNSVLAFLNWCRMKPRRWLAELPTFERDQNVRKPKHRRARRVTELTPDLILFLARHAAPHLRGQIAIEWATGGRVSSVLYGCRLCDYVGAPGREQITFHDTKNGEPVTAALHAPSAAMMREYLEWRGDLHDREAPLFLTPRRDARGRRMPYAYNDRENGGQNKTAFMAMKRRARATIRKEAITMARALLKGGNRRGAAEIVAAARAKRQLVAQITQHWFRHALATQMLSKGDLRSAMEQGGWLDPNSVLGYAHDVPEVRRAIVNKIALGDPA